MKQLFAFFIALTLLLCSCSSGSDSEDTDSGNDLSNNACSSLGLNTRIVNGTECNSSNSPVVELSMQFANGSEAVCTGNVITSKQILTAAHCFFENPVSVKAKINSQWINISSAIVHPKVSVTDTAVENDVAILTLPSATSNPTLPLLLSRTPVSGDEIKIFGYGITENQNSTNDTTGALRSGEMEISKVQSKFIDARYTGDGSNTCSGDSGGPALYELGANDVGIVGILSSGLIESCTKGDVSKFTNIQSESVLSFITQYAPGVGAI